MPAFVHKGEYIPDNIFFIVDHDIRIAFKAAPRKSARTLALIFVPVNPAAEQSVPQRGNIFIAERL